MTDDHEREPTQPTQPKKGKPVEIPVPKVSTIRAAIRKVAQPEPGQPEQAGMRGKGSRRAPRGHSSGRQK